MRAYEAPGRTNQFRSGRIRPFSTSQKPNSFADFRAYQRLQRLGSLSYPTRIVGFPEGRWFPGTSGETNARDQWAQCGRSGEEAKCRLWSDPRASAARGHIHVVCEHTGSRCDLCMKDNDRAFNSAVPFLWSPDTEVYCHYNLDISSKACSSTLERI